MVWSDWYVMVKSAPIIFMMPFGMSVWLNQVNAKFK